MNAFGHVSVGLVLGLIIGSPEAMPVVTTAVASLLPDIDHEKSAYGRYNPLAKYMKHRGFTHTILGAVTLSLPFLLISPELFSCAFLGCVSHILADKVQSVFPGHSRFRLRLWRGR